MSAYFSSTFKKPLYAAFAVALLVLCVLGTHWVGLSHGISHANNQSADTTTSSKIDKTFNHSSDVCHLYDALSLAGFVPSAKSDSQVIFLGERSGLSAEKTFLKSLIDSAYQSRAPPTFIL